MVALAMNPASQLNHLTGMLRTKFTARMSFIHIMPPEWKDPSENIRQRLGRAKNIARGSVMQQRICWEQDASGDWQCESRTMQAGDISRPGASPPTDYNQRD
jgi:hypothetical protein